MVNAISEVGCALMIGGNISGLTRNITTAIALETSKGDLPLAVGLGLVLIALVFIGPKTPWGWLGIIPLATGFLSTCPLYSLIGVNTCKK